MFADSEPLGVVVLSKSRWIGSYSYSYSYSYSLDFRVRVACPLRAWRLGEKPPAGVPESLPRFQSLTQRRQDAKGDGGGGGWIDDCRVMIVNF
jgi:hypothetical protein